MIGRVSSLQAKPRTGSEHGIPKLHIASAQVRFEGIEGDYNKYRTQKLKRDPAKAILLLPREILADLRAQGWPVEPGHLGENITTEGIANDELAVGTRVTIGNEVVLEISEPCVPCSTLRVLEYVGRARLRDFMRTLKGRRGWYARVISEGEIEVGDGVLPSVDRYMETNPERRAVVVAGRGRSPTPVLETTRLVLRPPTRDHAEGFFRMRAQPEATRFLFVTPFGSVEDAAASMERIALQRVTGKTVSWAITLRDGGAFIGVCGLVRIDHGTGSAHVAYELDARHWGHGFMAEALERVLAHGRDELGLARFEAHIDPQNERSIRLAERLAFTYSSSTREGDGPGPDDTAIYSTGDPLK